MAWNPIDPDNRNLASSYQQIIANMLCIQEEILPAIVILNNTLFSTAGLDSGNSDIRYIEDVMRAVGISILDNHREDDLAPEQYHRHVTFEFKMPRSIGLDAGYVPDEDENKPIILLTATNGTAVTDTEDNMSNFRPWQFAFCIVTDENAVIFRLLGRVAEYNEDTLVWGDWKTVSDNKDITTRIKNLEDHMREAESNIQEAFAKISDLTNSLANTKDELEGEITSEVNAAKDEFNSAIGVVDTRVTEVSGQLSDLSDRVDAIDTEIDSVVDEKIQPLTTRVDDLNTRLSDAIDNFNTSLENMSDSINELTNRIKNRVVSSYTTPTNQQTGDYWLFPLEPQDNEYIAEGPYYLQNTETEEIEHIGDIANILGTADPSIEDPTESDITPITDYLTPEG